MAWRRWGPSDHEASGAMQAWHHHVIEWRITATVLFGRVGLREQALLLSIH